MARQRSRERVIGSESVWLLYRNVASKQLEKDFAGCLPAAREPIFIQPVPTPDQVRRRLFQDHALEEHFVTKRTNVGTKGTLRTFMRAVDWVRPRYAVQYKQASG